MAKHTKPPQPTASELSAFVDQEGTMTAPTGDNFKIRIRVVDARAIFGRLELRVTPLAGSGHAWTTRSSVELDQESEGK